MHIFLDDVNYVISNSKKVMFFNAEKISPQDFLTHTRVTAVLFDKQFGTVNS